MVHGWLTFLASINLKDCLGGRLDSRDFNHVFFTLGVVCHASLINVTQQQLALLP